MHPGIERLRGCLLLLCLAPAAGVGAACDKPVYLTFDTGHMEVAPMVADVLKRHDVKVTFFLANERTKTGGTSLDDTWAPWWRARAGEGHAFGSHTWDHDSWLGDVLGKATGSTPSTTPSAAPRLRTKPSAGSTAGQPRELSAQQYCEELERPATRFAAITGRRLSALFRAPGGKTSPLLLQTAAQCGWAHVGWAPAGFLGDELPSERYPNAQLLANALRDIKVGDILVAHLGIWQRREVWAPVVLEPLIIGLKGRGLCFATLREHPTLGLAARTLR